MDINVWEKSRTVGALYSKPSIDQGLTTDEKLKKYEALVRAVPNITENSMKISSYAQVEGAFGQVYFGIHRGNEIVKKEFKSIGRKTMRIFSLAEAVLLHRCNHPNIVRLIGAGPSTAKADVRFIVLERAQNASLADLMDSHVRFYIWHVILWSLQIANGLDYLHSPPDLIYHRDLKPANLLLFNNCTVVKITDFGCAKDIRVGEGESNTSNVGSQRYMAPEIKDDKNTRIVYKEMVDIYSFGFTIWDLLVQRTEQWISPQVYSIHQCPPFLQLVLNKCLSKEPTERPRARQLVSMFDALMTTAYPFPDLSPLHINFTATRRNSFSYQQIRSIRGGSTESTYSMSLGEPTILPYQNDINMSSMYLTSTLQQTHLSNMHYSDESLYPEEETPPPMFRMFRVENTPPSQQEYEQDILHDVPHLLRPVKPDESSAESMKIYNAHLNLLPQYVWVSREVKSLQEAWDRRLTDLLKRKGIPSTGNLTEDYKNRVFRYCELVTEKLQKKQSLASRRSSTPYKSSH